MKLSVLVELSHNLFLEFLWGNFYFVSDIIPTSSKGQPQLLKTNLCSEARVTSSRIPKNLSLGLRGHASSGQKGSSELRCQLNCADH